MLFSAKPDMRYEIPCVNQTLAPAPASHRIKVVGGSAFPVGGYARFSESRLIAKDLLSQVVDRHGTFEVGHDCIGAVLLPDECAP